MREVWKIIQDPGFRHARRQIFQHIVDRDPKTAYARLAASLARLDCDDVSICHGQNVRGYGACVKPQATSRACDLMGLVGLSPDALDRFPHQFSGGQRQRIAIARALAMEPVLLIGDEPVSALDVSVQAQVLQLLDAVRKKFDLAVLFITHDLRVAAQICDRIAVMQRGVVVETGPTASVFADPQHEYTRALFTAAPGQGFGSRIGSGDSAVARSVDVIQPK